MHPAQSSHKVWIGNLLTWRIMHNMPWCCHSSQQVVVHATDHSQCVYTVILGHTHHSQSNTAIHSQRQAEKYPVILNLVNRSVDKAPQNLSTVVRVQQDVVSCPAVAELETIGLYAAIRLQSTTLNSTHQGPMVVCVRAINCINCTPFAAIVLPQRTHNLPASMHSACCSAGEQCGHV